MMKTNRGLLAVLLAAAALSAAGGKVEPRNYYGNIAQRLGDMLPKYHVLQQRLDDEISRRAWTNLVTFYDFDHSMFLKSDLEMYFSIHAFSCAILLMNLFFSLSK